MPNNRKIKQFRKIQQFPYVQECGNCQGYGWAILRDENLIWDFIWDECRECDSRGYTIPPEWTSN